MKKYQHTGLLILFFAWFALVEVFAQSIVVKGVVADEKGETLINVTIKDKDGKFLGMSDTDGKFIITTETDQVLTFVSVGFATKNVKLKGQQLLRVEMSSEDKRISEVVVSAKRIIDRFVPEKTEMEVVGNYVKITPKIKIPVEMRKAFTRLVVQPVLINITRKTRVLFKPAVVDAREYGITQDRMKEFDMKANDPLAPYLCSSEHIGDFDVVAYKDSLYLDNPNDDYRSDIFMYLENYRNVIYRDTATIARGIVNPFRFFEYKLNYMSITDEKYFPKPELQLREDKGEVNLTFYTGKATIDDSNPNNAIELQRLKERISFIENDPKAKLLSMSITGVSSPDGYYKRNKTLAQERALTAKNSIMDLLHPSTVNQLKDSIKVQSYVETWEKAVELMEKDQIPEVENVKAILAKYPDNPDAQYLHLWKLPIYQKHIRSSYLPKMRRVEYHFAYSVFRMLQDDEIKDIYNQNYKDLSRHEFWRIFSSAKDESEKEIICKRALEVYPRFLLAANELSGIYIQKKKYEESLLKPFAQKDAPVALLSNQVLTLLSLNKYSAADSIVKLIPEGEAEAVRSISNALNGDYQNAYNHFASQGGINEVILLLALKKNEEARQKALLLPAGIARHEYIKAVASNRTDHVSDAMKFLKKAFELDPSLKEIAAVDGDILDLLLGDTEK